MASGNLDRKRILGGAPASSRVKALSPKASQKNGEEDLDTYIERFISNGLKLQKELMVNHEAIEAARREYLAEYQRRRQSSK